jgi:ABC-type sugar transport system ATPase subunit/ribose/xylose/arabinose/galactoside ABC-type transport system permease subunit
MSSESSSASLNTPLQLTSVSKQFSGVHALQSIDIEFHAGAIHALVGENGAGKSTLINVCTGLLQPDTGNITIDGREHKLANPLAAGHRGIFAIHQEADLFSELSLAENMLLGQGLQCNRWGLIQWQATYERASEELSQMGEHANVRAAAASFSIGRRVIAEIAAALGRGPRVLFLDEPTASLTAAESERLFEKLLQLKKEGVAVVYVSHRLEEVLEISDTITVLRDGKLVTTEPQSAFNMDRLVSLMVGRKTSVLFSREHGKPGEVVFEAENLQCPMQRFADISFNISQGEVVGLYGLVGSGRSEMARAIFGLERKQGTVKLNGENTNIKNPGAAARAKLAYLPEDRLTEGVFPGHSAQSNATSAILPRLGRWGFISAKAESNTAKRIIDRLQVKLDSPAQPINTLSGGNQQKLVLGRWLETQPEVLILDEPTRGVDVGAKAEIHRLIDELAGRGKAILLISSELPEVMRMSDRVLVMCEGRIRGEFDPRTTSQEEVAAAAFPRSDDIVKQQQASHNEGIAAGIMQFRELGIVAALGVIAALMSLAQPGEFATFKNLIDVLTAASIVSIAAAGMTLVVAAGGIDISIGSMLGLVGAAAGLLAMQGVHPLLCLAIAIGLGAVLGSLNSLLSTLGRIHPIIVTLAGISIYRGVMLQVTGGYEVNPLPDSYRVLTDGRLMGVPKVLWYAIAVLALNWILLSRTLLGRRLLAVGNSEKAARLIGLSPWRLRLAAFAIMGALIGLASVMWGGYYSKIQSNTGLGWELQVVAATVIGGCSILGGKGTALGAFLGAVLIALIYNSLVILQISAYWQNLFVGALILAAVLTDVWLPEITARWRQRRRVL